MVAVLLLWATIATLSPEAVFKSSKEPQALLAAALECAASKDTSLHRLLLTQLSKIHFLKRLDSENDYLGPPAKLRLARVIDALRENPAAHSVLVGLVDAKEFTSFEPRQDLLIRALSSVRPAPEPVIRFWNRHAQPGRPYLDLAIEAMADNLSESALSLMERKLADPRFDSSDKLGWMRDAILRHRTDAAMLHLADRLLTNSLARPLRPQLVEALVDYRPSEWYVGEDPPQPPDPRKASPEARQLLRALLERALNEIPLSPRQKAAVRKSLDALAAMQ